MNQNFEKPIFDSETSPESIALQQRRDRLIGEIGSIPFTNTAARFRKGLEGRHQDVHGYVAMHVLGGSSGIQRERFDLGGEDSVDHFLSSMEEIIVLIERVREIHDNPTHPRFNELSTILARAVREHPEWGNQAAWRLVLDNKATSTTDRTFDTPDGAVGAFIKQLADKFIS